MVLYELAILGSPSETQLAELTREIEGLIQPFELGLREEVGWSVAPTTFSPSQRTAVAAAFWGGDGPAADIHALLRKGVPIIPIASAHGRVQAEIPSQLWPFNCLAYDTDGPLRIATALLECVGLLPRQRRVFVSYRRGESRSAALQLFDAFSARQFDVFLDTHGILPADDFQAVLWHRLCDSDVLVMLDTTGYFEGRWTNAEFGRALAKGISVLRVGWPDCKASPRILSASRVDLEKDDFDATGCLREDAIGRICLQAEAVRSQSHAVRNLNLVSNVRQAIERIGGSLVGVGAHHAIYVKLPGGGDAVLYPTTGVPTSVTLHEAADCSGDRSVAVLYDHVGMHPRWLEHLDWLAARIQEVRWVKVSEAAWNMADWQ